jgi:hypothetical protein
MALGSSASNRNEYQVYLGGKGGLCVRLTTYHHTVRLSRNLGALTSLDPSGPVWPVTGVLNRYLTACTLRKSHVNAVQDINVKTG